MEILQSVPDSGDIIPAHTDSPTASGTQPEAGVVSQHSTSSSGPRTRLKRCWQCEDFGRYERVYDFKMLKSACQSIDWDRISSEETARVLLELRCETFSAAESAFLSREPVLYLPPPWFNPDQQAEKFDFKFKKALEFYVFETPARLRPIAKKFLLFYMTEIVPFLDEPSDTTGGTGACGCKRSPLYGFWLFQMKQTGLLRRDLSGLLRDGQVEIITRWIETVMLRMKGIIEGWTGSRGIDAVLGRLAFFELDQQLYRHLEKFFFMIRSERIELLILKYVNIHNDVNLELVRAIEEATVSKSKFHRRLVRETIEGYDRNIARLEKAVL